jgi:hypothetical protein
MTDTQTLSEQTFFKDPAIDRVLGVAMTLAAELWVLRDRVHALESLLIEKGVAAQGALDAWRPSAAEGEALARDRDAFVHQVMQNLLGRQVSKGATDELLARHGVQPRRP